MKKILLPALRALVSIGFIAILLYLTRDTLHQIPGILKGMDIKFFILSLLLQVIVIVMIGLRFKKLLSIHNIEISLKDSSSLTFIGYFFNNFLPSAVGGDLVKAYYSARNSRRKVESLSAVMADRAIGLFTLVSIGIVVVHFLKFECGDIKRLLWVIFFSFLASIFFISNRRFAHLAKEVLSKMHLTALAERLKLLYKTLSVYKHHRGVLFSTIILSLSAQFVGVASMYLVARCLYLTISFRLLLAIMPIVAVVSMFPSLNGLGIREGAFVYFLGGSIGREGALTWSLLNLFGLFFVSIIGGVIYLFNRGSLKMEVVQ